MSEKQKGFFTEGHKCIPTSELLELIKEMQVRIFMLEGSSELYDKASQMIDKYKTNCDLITEIVEYFNAHEWEDRILSQIIKRSN